MVRPNEGHLSVYTTITLSIMVRPNEGHLSVYTTITLVYYGQTQ